MFRNYHVNYFVFKLLKKNYFIHFQIKKFWDMCCSSVVVDIFG